jgi:hypothetical protein
VLLALMILVGISAADGESNIVPYENPTTTEKKNLTFDMQQNVSGTGFFAAYKRASMPDAVGTEGEFNNGVEASNNAHGSGQIDSESLMYAESSYYNMTWVNGAYDEDGEIIEDDEDAASIITMNEKSKMTYGKSSMPIGTRYYADHAVVFDSRLDESTWIKNRDAMNSISNRIQDAGRLDLTLDASLDTTTTAMKLEEDMTEGRAHFAAIQFAGIPRDEEPEDEDEAEEFVPGAAMKAWHNPDNVLEEDYSGSYHITESLTMKVEDDDSEEEDDWLPCCSGGFFDMNEMDKKGRSVQGVFDCTCFRKALGLGGQ